MALRTVLGTNAMFFVICHLNLATALRLLDGLFHRIGHNVCIHDDFTIGVTAARPIV